MLHNFELETQLQVVIGERIIIVGNTGSGRATLAQQLGRCLDLPHTELDALHWEPNWIAVETAVFQQKVTQVIETDNCLKILAQYDAYHKIAA